MVCSGDYLPDGEDCDTNTYLCFEGKFIKWMLIVIYSIFGASFLSIVVISAIVHSKQKAEDKKNAEASGVSVKEYETFKPQSAFTKALDPDYEAAMGEHKVSIY